MCNVTRILPKLTFWKVQPGFFPQNVGELNLWFRGISGSPSQGGHNCYWFQSFIPIAMKTGQQKFPWTFTARYVYIYMEYIHIEYIYIYIPHKSFLWKDLFFPMSIVCWYSCFFFRIFHFLASYLVRNGPPPLQKSSFAAPPHGTMNVRSYLGTHDSMMAKIDWMPWEPVEVLCFFFDLSPYELFDGIILNFLCVIYDLYIIYISMIIYIYIYYIYKDTI